MNLSPAAEPAPQALPGSCQGWYELGLALMQRRDRPGACKAFLSALALEPAHSDTHYHLGHALSALGQAKAAQQAYAQALRHNPAHLEAALALAALWGSRGHYEGADVICRLALMLAPERADLHFLQAHALHMLRRYEQALQAYERALALKPDYAEVYLSRGVALKELKRVEEALASYDRAIALKPDCAEAYWNKSLALLVAGEFVQGWDLYEWRWKRETFTSPKRNFSQPLWPGTEDIVGKTLLLHAEQGLGDTIQFCRYAKLVKALGARVILEVPKALLGLLSGLEGVDELIEKGKALPAFDCHCPLLSLPLAFKTDLTNIPSPKPYLAASSQKTAEWAQRLGAKSKPRVGLVWSGSTAHKNDPNRSLTLQQLLPHLPGCCEYVSLQKEVREVDVQVLEGSGIGHYEQHIKDFVDTAALCQLMDLVISVDTSVAHLAGALGKTTWVLLPYAPDWRWLLDRDDSPWYESVKLYRQDASREWLSVLETLEGDL